MLTSTPEYKAIVTSQTDYRKWEYKATYSQIATGAKASCTATASELKPESLADYSIDDIRNVPYNYGTLEDDRYKLDGSFALVPDDTILTDIQTINDNLSDIITKEFASIWDLTLTFSSAFSSSGITITFDVLNNEYAEDFIVTYYDVSDTLIDTITVTGNTTTIYSGVEFVDNFTKIVISISKWSKGERLARIMEVDFGVYYEYSTSNSLLIDANTQETLDPLNLEVRGNDCNFTIDNRNNLFNPLITGTGLDYALTGQIINLSVGLYTDPTTIEYINLGKYYLRDIKADSEAKTAKFNCLSKLSLMNYSEYKKSVYGSQTLYDLAEDVLQDYGLVSSEYVIDASLSSITVNSFLPIMSYKECLQAIALAANVVLYELRDGKIYLQPLPRTTNNYNILQENVYKDPNIEQLQGLYKLDISKYSYTTDPSTTLVTQLVTIGTYDVTIEYDPSSSVSASLSSGSINSATYYTSYCILNITAPGTVTLTITGTPLVETVVNRKLTTANNKGKTISLTNNLITTDTQVTNTQTWIQTELAFFNQLSCEWRGDPTIEIGDQIDNVETQFVNQLDAIVFQNDIEYKGYLRAKTKLIGGI